ncbi:hypothetical protein [Enterococcus sp. DIV0800]|uniref:hypothetical protein n=1 Tax=unclassified Enterococcus TaxID=2608891 RepID=UPI003D2FA8A2
MSEKQTKRTMKVTLKFKSGDTLVLTGDEAQRVYQQYKQRYLGDIKNGLMFKNAAGNEEYLDFECLCGYELGETTAEEIDGRDCEPFDCFEPTPPTP